MDAELKLMVDGFENDKETIAFMHTQYAGRDIPEEHITAEVIQLRELIKTWDFKASEHYTKRIAELESAIAELVLQVRTNDGHECIYRLRCQGLIK